MSTPEPSKEGKKEGGNGSEIETNKEIKTKIIASKAKSVKSKRRSGEGGSKPIISP